MIQPIVMYSPSHKILTTKTKQSDVSKKEELQVLIQNMKDTLNSVGGLGLAANQLGRDESVCLVKFEDQIVTMINPTITIC